MLMMMCKQLLGTHKSTTNCGVLLELGRKPLEIYVIKQAVKNWERIRKKKANPLVIASYSDAQENNLLWLSRIKLTLEENGMLNFFQNPYADKPIFIYQKIFERLSDQFHQTSFAYINGENSKLRTYAIFKGEIGFENYLSAIKNTHRRKQVSKFRLSNHTLMIETGRHNVPFIKKELRFCPFCKTYVETELHFLLQYPLYSINRDILLQHVLLSNPAFLSYTTIEKFGYIMSEIDNDIAKFISDSFEVRTFLLTNPKRNA